MSVLKEIAAWGADHIETGNNDFDSWSQVMINEVGPNVKPFLREIRQWSLIIAQRKAGARAMKMNCWDYQQCGREANGSRVRKLGICPVYLFPGLDGIHGGKNGGRACWIIRDVTCGSTLQRMFIPHCLACFSCHFRRSVMNDEGPDCIISDSFLTLLTH